MPLRLARVVGGGVAARGTHPNSWFCSWENPVKDSTGPIPSNWIHNRLLVEVVSDGSLHLSDDRFYFTLLYRIHFLNNMRPLSSKSIIFLTFLQRILDVNRLDEVMLIQTMCKINIETDDASKLMQIYFNPRSGY